MVQGSDAGHGACSDLTYSCAPDPSNIYLFITDKTSQGIKLLQRASEVASDISSWSCRCPMIHWHWVTVAMATCLLMRMTGKTRRQRENQKCICQIVCDHRSVTAGLCRCVQKAQSYVQRRVFRENKTCQFLHFFNLKSLINSNV